MMFFTRLLILYAACVNSFLLPKSRFVVLFPKNHCYNNSVELKD